MRRIGCLKRWTTAFLRVDLLDWVGEVGLKFDPFLKLRREGESASEFAK